MFLGCRSPWWNGVTAWSGAFGTRRQDSGEPVRTDTIFQAASLSKPVFAITVLRLVELAVLELDTPLSGYLPDEYGADDSQLDQITARHVLSHTTGWPNWRPDGQPLRRESPLGERFTYSGEGYVYLQHVAEHRSVRLSTRSSARTCSRRCIWPRVALSGDQPTIHRARLATGPTVRRSRRISASGQMRPRACIRHPAITRISCRPS